MAKMKNLNEMLLLMDLVVNQNRAVDQLPYPRPFASGVSHAGKAAEQIDVIEQSLSKTGSGPVVVLAICPTISDRSSSALCVKRRR
jgi:hypothetical protein